MDRREALKKLMAGGAVAAGASIVSSSAVFAAGSVGAGQPQGSGMTTPPPPAQTINEKRRATWTITAPNLSCSSGTMQVASYALISTPSADTEVSILAPTGFGDPYIAGANSTTFMVERPRKGNFRQGDQFEVTWHVRYSCIVAGQQVGCQLVDYTYRYVNQGAGSNPNWQPVFGTPFASSPRPCAL